MGYKVLYEIEFGNLQLQVIMIPIVLIFLGLIGARIIKKYGFSVPRWFPKFYSQTFLNNYTRFLSMLVALFGVIVLVVLLIKIPMTLFERKELKDAIASRNVMTVEGKIYNFSPAIDGERDTESFLIDGVKFKYSDYDDSYGYHKTSKQNGVIKGDGQYLRITYCSLKGKKIILKIEKIINY